MADGWRISGLITLWLGRLAAVALFLFWGAFLVAHLGEWFANEQGELPPAWVWVGTALHVAMLVGLAMLVHWSRLGALVTVVATATFFWWIEMKSFPYIALLNAVPVMLVLLGYGMPRRGEASQRAATAGH